MERTPPLLLPFHNPIEPATMPLWGSENYPASKDSRSARQTIASLVKEEATRPEALTLELRRLAGSKAGEARAMGAFDPIAEEYDRCYEKPEGRAIFAAELECLRSLVGRMEREWLEVRSR
jgi:hypothetical protein